MIFLLLLIGGFSLATYSSSTQTLIAKQYLKRLANKLNTKITVDKVDIILFNKAIITNLYVEDLHQDTLFYIKKLEINIDEFSIEKKNILLNKAVLSETYFNLKKYDGETTNNLQFIINYFTPKDSSNKNEWEFKLDKISVIDGRFDYNNDNYDKKITGIDYEHVEITYLNTELSNIDFIPQGLRCSIDKMKFFEQSGFQMDELIAQFNISPQGIITEDLMIKTPYSDIKGDINFLTETYKDMANFITDVTIKSEISSSLVSFKDICFFAPTLDCLNKSLTFDGQIKGSIANLKGKKLAIVLDDGTIFKGSANLSGLPNVEDMFMYINVKELVTSKQNLEQLPLYPFVTESYVKLPANFKHLKTIRFKGNFTGFYHDFVAYGNFKTHLGDITTDVAVKLDKGKTSYNGQLITNHFNLGQFFEMKKNLGAITMNVNIKGSGFSKEELRANLNGNVEQVVINDYEYNNVRVKGEFSDQVFNGFLAVKDENISFDFNGEVNLKNKIPEFNFTSNIVNVKLAKLNLINSEKKLKTRFSTKLKVNLKGNHIDNMIGKIEISDAKYYDKLDSILIQKIIVTSKNENEHQQFKIKSDVLDFNLEGKYHFSQLANVTQAFMENFIPSLKNEEKKYVYIENDFKFNMELHNSAIISKVFLKGITFSEHTTLSGFYKSIDQSLTINGIVPTANVLGVEINNSNLSVNSGNKILYVNLGVDKIYQNDSVYINNFNLSTSLNNDSLQTNLNWKNTAHSSKSEADISFNTLFKGYDYSLSHINNSYIFVADKLWAFNEDNAIILDTNTLHIKNLSFATDNQSILIDGELSNSPEDQIDIALKKFNLSNIEKIIPEKIIKLEGVVDGVASISNLKKELLFTSNLNVDQFKINDYLVGKGEANSTWNTREESLHLEGKFYRDHIPTILVGGYYYPRKEEESLDLNLELYQTKLNIFDSYIENYVSGLGGMANAKIAVSGNLQEPKLNGNITLQKAKFHINYLNTTYQSDLFKINIIPNMISFDNIVLTDEKNNVAFANGTIFHEWFKKWSLDVGLSANNFLVLNTKEKDNKLYYGKAYVSGLINIGGDGEQMNIDINVQSEKGSVLNIPLNDEESIAENNFIEFVSNDTSSLNIETKEKVDLSNINMNFDLNITPDAEIRLIFDDQVGDVMRSTGNGNVKMEINTNGDLNMYGDYTVKDGDYLFTLQNVINKRFDLEAGGTISWNGSPYDAQLNITAIYRLRARLFELLAGLGDTTAVYKKRIPVDLKLRMRNNMLNPDINFDIDLPTADEDTRGKVKSVLYVNNQQENIQELNKQVFSLLVLNQFLPPPGVETNTGYGNVGATTSSELLSNQLSNWLSKINDDFDIGVNYRPGDEISNQELELALSTQIFNDRLIIDSNFGLSNRENVSSSTQQTNNLIGDVSLEYKITKDGKLRVKAFNTSNQYSLENTNSLYTQGLGLFYKEEFDTISEFFSKLFGTYKKKTAK